MSLLLLFEDLDKLYESSNYKNMEDIKNKIWNTKTGAHYKLTRFKSTDELLKILEYCESKDEKSEKAPVLKYSLTKSRPKSEICNECGAVLTHSGECPVCDFYEYDLLDEYLLEKMDRRLTKALSNKIMQTTNPAGQGKKYKKYIDHIKKHADDFDGIASGSFIVAHHVNGDHSKNNKDNIVFVAFESHSAYHSKLIEQIDAYLVSNPLVECDYDELDFLARVTQINTFITKCNTLYKDKTNDVIQELPKINIDIKKLTDIRKNIATVRQRFHDNLIKEIPCVKLTDVEAHMEAVAKEEKILKAKGDN